MASDTGLATRHGGMVSWVHVYKDYQPDLAFTSGTKPPSFQYMIQLVRDPLASLTSMAFTEPLLSNAGYLNFVSRHVAMVDAETTINLDGKNNATDLPPAFHTLRIRRALEFYTGWHRAIAALHVPLIRLEECNAETIQGIFKLLGRSPPDRELIEEKIEMGLRQSGRRRLANDEEAAQDEFNVPKGTSSIEPPTQNRLSTRPAMSPTIDVRTPAMEDGLQNQQHPWPTTKQSRRLGIARPTKRLAKKKRQRKRRPVKKGVHKNQRYHRPSLEWKELCQVDVQLTIEFLDLAQSFGYYDEMGTDVDRVCDVWT